MKYPATLFLSFVLFVTITADMQSQVTANVFERVLNVRVNAATDHEMTATAFTLDVDRREYLITAKHVVKNLHDEDTIDIFMNERWSPLKVRIFRCADPVDIAVLIPPHQLTVNFELQFATSAFILGQDAFFLGFPYGIQPVGRGVNGPYPLAVIKRGTISTVMPGGPSEQGGMILLDGYNNPGFSGGPIVYRDLNQGGVVLKLAGVVSGFLPEVVSVMKEHDIKSPENAADIAKGQPWRIRQKNDGSYFELLDNGTYVALNTGIIEGFLIEPAIDLIHHHEIGPEAKDLPGNAPAF